VKHGKQNTINTIIWKNDAKPVDSRDVICNNKARARLIVFQFSIPMPIFLHYSNHSW